MKLHYMGKFDGNPDSLPKCEHEANAVKFKECESMEKLTEITLGISGITLVILGIIFFLRTGGLKFDFWGILLTFICMYPHEFLHAICFKEDVYMYSNFKQAMLFVVGPERMTKQKFCFMSMLPCIILGIIPFTIFVINPELVILGTFGMFSMSTCVGDWYNVFNAITQMPKGAKTYLCGMNSYWYMPEKDGENM